MVGGGALCSAAPYVVCVTKPGLRETAWVD